MAEIDHRAEHYAFRGLKIVYRRLEWLRLHVRVTNARATRDELSTDNDRQIYSRPVRFSIPNRLSL